MGNETFYCDGHMVHIAHGAHLVITCVQQVYLPQVAIVMISGLSIL